ncbi:hypothetical protein ACOSQ4_013840 [Xanthoceras sorbifolium]
MKKKIRKKIVWVVVWLMINKEKKSLEEEEEESLGGNWKKVIWVSAKKLLESLSVQKNIGRRRRRKFGCKLEKNCLGVYKKKKKQLKKKLWCQQKKIGRIVWVSAKKLFGNLGLQKKYCLEVWV